MAAIFLKWFGGMIPRTGEQHLVGLGQSTERFATDARNANLYSGELRPLTKPTLIHVFCSPGDDCYTGPDPADIGCRDDLPPPTFDCVPVVITSHPESSTGTVGQTTLFIVNTNVDASAPIYYQWYKNGAVIQGEVGPQYGLLVTEDSIYDRFTVSVQNPCQEQCLISNAAVITELVP